MAVVEHHFLLDTGTWVAVRRRRLFERFALVALLIGGAILTVGLIWGGTMLYRTLSQRSTTPATPAAEVVIAAPPAAKTPIAVWNGLGSDGAAAEAARQLMLDKYPIAAVSDAPDHSYMKTYVMYQVSDPAGKSAATAMIKRLNLQGAVVTPMEGVRKDQLAGARLLLIVADPLSH